MSKAAKKTKRTSRTSLGLLDEEYLECTTNGHNKWWYYRLEEIHDYEYLVTFRWGKIGTVGTYTTKTFSSRTTAEEHIFAKTNEKYDKWYNSEDIPDLVRQVSDGTYVAPSKEVVKTRKPRVTKDKSLGLPDSEWNVF